MAIFHLDTHVLEDLKDQLHLRIVALTREEPDRLACWLWTGGIHHSGIPIMRFLGRQWSVARLSAWIYLENPFDLTDRSVRVLRRCRHRLCVKYSHLLIAQGRAPALAVA